MPITISQLANSLRYLLNDPSDVAWSYSASSDDSKRLSLWQAAREVASDLHINAEEITFNTVASTASYELSYSAGTGSGSTYRILRAMIQIGGSRWMTLKPISDRSKPDHITEGVPEYYWFESWTASGNPFISLWQTPNAIYPVKLWALTVPMENVAGTTQINPSPEADELITLLAAKRLKIGELDHIGSAFYDREIALERRVALMGRAPERAVR